MHSRSKKRLKLILRAKEQKLGPEEFYCRDWKTSPQWQIVSPEAPAAQDFNGDEEEEDDVYRALAVVTSMSLFVHKGVLPIETIVITCICM